MPCPSNENSRDLFGKFPEFEGSFAEKFVPTEYVNKSLLLLLQMILEVSRMVIRVLLLGK